MSSRGGGGGASAPDDAGVTGRVGGTGGKSKTSGSKVRLLQGSGGGMKAFVVDEGCAPRGAACAPATFAWFCARGVCRGFYKSFMAF